MAVNRRRYHSPQRLRQAQATRQQVIEAAARLFEESGYFGATIEAIAQAAGVAEQTVYAAFGSKRVILSALIDQAIFGGDPPDTPVAERSWYREVADISTPERLLRRWGEYLCDVNARVAPVQRVVESAASSDPKIAELLQGIKDQRLVGQSAIADLLAERTWLRPGLGMQEAADIIYALSDASLYDTLVLDRGWSTRQMGRWLGDTLCSLLLPSGGASAARQQPL